MPRPNPFYGHMANIDCTANYLPYAKNILLDLDMTHAIRPISLLSILLCLPLWLTACGGEPVGGVDNAPLVTTETPENNQPSTGESTGEPATETNTQEEVDPPQRPPGDIILGKTTYTGQCAMCHGEAGNGAFPLFINAVEFEAIEDVTHRTMPFEIGRAHV